MEKTKTIINSGTANLSIRIDKELKKQAEQLFNEIGMNLTTAFTVFVKQAVREGGFPFDININSSSANAHRQYILKELSKAKREANSPDAVWHNEEDVMAMLDNDI